MSQHPLSSVLFLTSLRASSWSVGICLTPEPTSALGMVSHHAVSYPTAKNSFLQKWIYELLLRSSQLYASAKRPPLNPSSEAGILPGVKHKSRPPHVTYSISAAYIWYLTFVCSVTYSILHPPPRVLSDQAALTGVDVPKLKLLLSVLKAKSASDSCSHCAGSPTPVSLTRPVLQPSKLHSTILTLKR